MTLQEPTPARRRLAAAITARGTAETNLSNASKACELQAAELAKAKAASEKYADLDSRAATAAAYRIRNAVKTGKTEPIGNHHAGLRSEREAKRRAEELVITERLAYDQLQSELADANGELADMVRQLNAAVEATLLEDAMRLLASAKQADARAAELRRQLLSVDIWVSLQGVAPRLLLTQTPQVSEWLRNEPETARAKRTPEDTARWRALFGDLASDPTAIWETYANRAVPKPTMQPVQPQMRYEDSAEYLDLNQRAARHAPSHSDGNL